MLSWFWRHASKDASFPARITSLVRFLSEGQSIAKETMTSHCEVGEMLARRLGFSEDIQHAVRFSLEHWDGSSPVYGVKGEDIPVTARVIHMAQVVEVGHRYGGIPAAVAVAKQRKGKDFDPLLVDTLLELSADRDFWGPLELETAQSIILDMKPPSSFDHVSDDQVDRVCETIADFTDIRSSEMWDHSHRVATFAVATGQALGLGQREIVTLRRSALVHDLGKAALPGGILLKKGNLQQKEWEQFRLHPYYTERILDRVETFRPLVADAAAHHERMDGQGFHRRIGGDQIPLGARILAVADTYEVLSRDREEEDAATILQEMRDLVGTHLDPDCFEALAASLGQKQLTDRRSIEGHSAHGLSERETEVLRELTKGLTNKQIAKALVISENTVERHLDNVYGKLGVSSRTSAAVWAVHNGLAS